MSSTTEEVEALSLVQRIAALDVGQTAALAERLDFDAISREDIKDTLERMRNTAQPAVSRAKKKTGGEFTVAYGHFHSQSHDIIATVAITRTK